MKVLFKPMGYYGTNCYIVFLENGEIIIDPGIGAYDWVVKNVKNPKAILNTHGHFDHIWSNKKLKDFFNIPIYAPKDDVFMIEKDSFGFGLETTNVDVKVGIDEKINIADEEIIFWTFAGHTPGCSALQIKNLLFSGDFLFKDSIGRVDFPYSNRGDMKKSILKILDFKDDLVIYPGHGESTTLKQEQKNLIGWLNYL
ncbi:MAG: MBL fold metallo-hydrolase [Campylobacteraceae bacterium]|nr:MBL fold metallo-hydrolase [Campylobacteraceae bacterium]